MLLRSAHVLDKHRDTKAQRSGFFAARKAEVQYAKALRGIARQVGIIVSGFGPDDPVGMQDALRRYAEAIDPWAKATAARMLADVSRRDEAAWAEISNEMSRALRDEIRMAPTGTLMKQLMAEQIVYIKSIPLDAAQRVHGLVIRGMEGAIRADEIAERINQSGHVSKGRANLIARTEVARAASTLVEARATYVGSEGYIWRTAEDADVRKLHRKHNGKFFRWDAPPVAGSNGERAHAGQIYNCRCYPEPVIPEEP